MFERDPEVFPALDKELFGEPMKRMKIEPRREGVFLRSRGFEGVEEGAEGESEEGEVVDCVLICGGFVVVLSILRILGSLTKESGLLLKTKEVTKVWGIFVSLKQATLFPCYVKVCL